jgi:feruloyl esterase
MQRYVGAGVLLLVLAVDAGAQDVATLTRRSAEFCQSLAATRLAGVRIVEATAVADTVSTAQVRVPHCRVSGVIDTETRFTLLLPDTWNRRFMMGGGSAYVGAVSNSMRPSVNDGFATAGTDAGHAGALFSAQWALNNAERQTSFAHLAVHRTAEVAKQLIREYYGAMPVKSYFIGCSTGGWQGLVEALRYPEDFDGVVSVAPVLTWTGMAAAAIRNTQVLYPAGTFDTPLLTPESLGLLHSAVLDACDARDGVRDRVLDDPRDCEFRVATLPACPDDTSQATCLTRAQRSAIETIYSPVSIGGRLVYPGRPMGNEAASGGWIPWLTAPRGATRPAAVPVIMFDLMRFFVKSDSAWNYATYDLRSFPEDTRGVRALMDADNPDLSAFAARGGKLILAHGWSDPAMSAFATIGYFDAIRGRDANADQFLRLFMLPGVLHCSGGPGCDVVDWTAAITAWVERGAAPATLIASKRGEPASGGGAAPIVRTRPICAYPMRARYNGSGSTDEAASFACR